MKMALVQFLAGGLVALLSMSAHAVKIKDADCADLNSFNQSVVPEYLAVINGYNQSGKNAMEESDMEGISAETRSIVKQCSTNKQARIRDLRTAPTTTKTSYANKENFNPLKAKCSQFLSLPKEVQPIAVFWIAGREKPDALRNGQVNV
jgi:hypothetical protein